MHINHAAQARKPTSLNFNFPCFDNVRGSARWVVLARQLLFSNSIADWLLPLILVSQEQWMNAHKRNIVVVALMTSEQGHTAITPDDA